MDAAQAIVGALGAVVVVCLGSVAFKLFKDLIWRPYTFNKLFAGQGISGPSYHVLAGSVPEYTKLLKEAQTMPMQEICHDIVPRVMPHYHKWSHTYGGTFLYWSGIHPRLYITEPELIKEILSNKFGYFNKQPPRPFIMALLGRGLVIINGLDWIKHRRIVNPAFNLDKLKTMVKAMAACTSSMLENWQEVLDQTRKFRMEIEVHDQFRAVTADIISHTAFGSSYNEGKEVFDLQRELQCMAAQADRTVFIPGSQYIPTRNNRHAWKLDRRIKQILHSIVQSRLESREAGGYGNDLLGLMMTANKNELNGNQRYMRLTIQEIMDECKTFFFAGHQTTSNLLTWTVFLLATNPAWQAILRKEVTSVCGTDIPDADTLSRLKTMTMVLKESLRLYSPVTMMIRKAYKETKLGGFLLPKGTTVILPVLAVHHSERFWGPDANQFKPERFGEGASKAAIHPNAFIPFSTGPRACVGQNFSMLESKMVLTMILQRWSFTLSPAYRHAPIAVLTLEPQYGMQIVFESIET